MAEKSFLRVEDLDVYMKLCQLHLEVCALTHTWPTEERFELGSQARRASNSLPSQLAEKNDDRHVRNKIEGVNRSRGEAAETLHHLFMAKLKGYMTDNVFGSFRDRYAECIRMLNGLERTLEKKIPEADRVWMVREASGWPSLIPDDYTRLSGPTPDTRHLTPDT